MSKKDEATSMANALVRELQYVLPMHKAEGLAKNLHYIIDHLCEGAAELEVELTRLRAEVESLRADAGRYRWLRDKAPGEIAFDHTEGQRDGGHRFKLLVPFDGEPIHNDEHSAMKLDAAIDAAKGGGNG